VKFDEPQENFTRNVSNNQCLYNFRGANPEYLEELCINRDIYGDPISLEVNYRFSQKVYLASQVTMPSQNIRIDEGSAVVGVAKVVINGGLNILQDVIARNNIPENMPYSEIMVLTHSWENARKIANYIDQKLCIPCFKVDKNLYDHSKPLLDWLGKLMAFVVADESLQKQRFNELTLFWRQLLFANDILNHEVSSHWYNQFLFDVLENSSSFADSGRDWLDFINMRIGLDEKLKKYRYLDDILEYEKFKQAMEDSKPLAGCSLQDLQDRTQLGNRIYVGTIHSRKGQESKVVILASPEDFEWLSQNEKENLFYVGLTRAKNEIFVTHDGRSSLAIKLDKSIQEIDE